MFAQLKGIVDLIRSGVSDFRNYRGAKEREDAVLDMLRVYFLLKDCVDDGEKLISEAQPNPVERISAMQANEALETITKWDATIRKQGIRLYQLQGALLGQHHIAVINPALQERIIEIIGYKMDRAVTLHGIGAALFFRQMFPVGDTNEEKARYISVMAGEEDDSLDMLRIRKEIAGLRESLDQYRSVVGQMATNAELLQLSQRARQETQFPNEA